MRPRRRAVLTGVLLCALAAGSLGSPAASGVIPQAAESEGAVTAAATLQSEAGRMCMGTFVRPQRDDTSAAEQIMSGQLPMPNFTVVPLPVDPTWREDPFGDAKWKFQYHSWDWLDRLRRVGIATGNEAMLDRYQFLMRDWLQDVPRGPGAPAESWGDMTVGMRSIMLSCAIARLGPLSWLVDAVNTHGAALADPAEYARFGNHAMHQNNGLLIAGVLADRADWRDLALSRNDVLLQRAVDEEGVSDEGSLGYQWSNYVWWNDARAWVVAAGLPVSPLYDRIPRMLDFFAHGTAPDGKPEMLGDTTFNQRGWVPGTASEYAATQGARGPKPSLLNRVYKAGYAFGRSTWDQTGFADATFWTMRFGPPLSQQVHGHADQGAVTLAAYGSRLLWDQGLYAFDGGPLRGYVRSAGAHNGVTVDGLRTDPDGAAPLLVYEDQAAYTLMTVEINSQRGAGWTRTMFYSKRGRYMLIEDRAHQKDGVSRTAVQRFHLGADRTLALRPGVAATSGAGANVGIFHIGASPAMRVVKGQQSPLMGWRSLQYREALPVPVVESRLRGPAVRFSTVVIPRAPGSRATSIGIADGVRTPTTTSVTVRAGDVYERVVVSATGATVTPL